ncbi:DUF6957 family protein [Halomonas gemina]|uniref:DUF6957 family protein n=1 Tax=Halomonas gemina TaxID=2945105 RepID=UPI003D3460A2
MDLEGKDVQFLYRTVVSDYKRRWQYGDYVFTSAVVKFDEETGLVKTKNSLYCLQGNGEEVFPTLREAARLRSGRPGDYSSRPPTDPDVRN